MKKIMIVVVFFFLTTFTYSQKNNSKVSHSSGKAKVEYTIEAGDGWYSIARKFKITYAELKMVNKQTEKLVVGAKLFIPSKLKSNDPFFEKNHTDKDKPVSGDHNKNVTHKVAKSENLFSISRKYNVTVDQLKRLNNLKSSSLKIGQVLTISEGRMNNDNAILNNPDIKPELKGEDTGHEKEESDKSDNSKLEKISKVNSEKVEPKIKEEKKENDYALKENSSDDKKIIFANGRQEVNESGVASWIDNESSGTNKYYALHRLAPIGTIIKITNKMNSKSIYVKVVGKLPDTGDNDGLIIKISKSGADKLGVIDQRFQANLIYGISASK